MDSPNSTTQQMDSILNSCDPILTMRDAELPIVTPLLPVKGLRHTETGELTEDAIKIIMDGIKSLGIQVDSDSTRDALLQEAKMVLCRLNGQYEFLLKELFTSISRSEAVDKKLVETLRGKNQSMQDVLSISRHVLDKPVEKMKEGFINTRFEPTRPIREGFQAIAEIVGERDALLEEERYNQLKDRGMKITEEKNAYAGHMTSLYSFLNIVAVGLLFYVMSS